LKAAAHKTQNGTPLRVKDIAVVTQGPKISPLYDALAGYSGMAGREG